MFTFLGQVKNELMQVTWPTRKQVTRLTFVVLAISLLVGIYLGIVDFIFTRLLEFIIS